MPEIITGKSVEERSSELRTEGYHQIEKLPFTTGFKVFSVWTKVENATVQKQPGLVLKNYAILTGDNILLGRFSIFRGFSHFEVDQDETCKVLYENDAGELIEQNVGVKY